MAGIISDLQQIYDWIVYLKDIHDTIEGNKDRCRLLITRCGGFENCLRSLDKTRYDDANVLAGVRTLSGTIGKCVEFVNKYGKTGWKRFVLNSSFAKSIEGEFKELNALLSQSANDLHFSLSVHSYEIDSASTADNEAIMLVLTELLESNAKITSDQSSILAQTANISSDQSLIVSQNAQISVDQSAILAKMAELESMNSVILDIRAAQLESQISNADSSVTLFVKDPRPTDEYDERSILGQGSFGVTHRMINTVDKGVYAVKEIKVTRAASAGIKKDELLKEAMTLQKLNHPHIVRYFTSYFSRNDTLFNVVMELISGGSLADKISDPGVSVVDIRRWLSQMASTLHYLHSEMRTQHRDIKAENIMLTNGSGGSGNGGSRIKLIDLGTASAMKTVASKMSRVGTSTYFSYEKANDIPYDGRDDVWGAGCVFAELLVKARLSERGGAVYLFTNKTVNDRRLLLIDDCVKVDVGLGSVIGRMLEPEQEQRCTSEELVRLMTSLVSCISAVAPSEVDTRLRVEQKRIEAQSPIFATPVAAAVVSFSYKEDAEQPKEAAKLTPVPMQCYAHLEKPQQHQNLHPSDLMTRISQASSSTAAVVPNHWFEKASWDVGRAAYVVKFSPDGSVIAVALWDSCNILINDPSGRLITTIEESSKRVYCLSFSPDGTKLAASSNDFCVKLFEVSSGRLLWSSTVYKTTQVCFCNNFTLVASEGEESCVIIDVSSGSITSRIRANGFRGLCVSNRGTLVTAGGGKVTIWDNLNSPRLSFDCSDLCSMCSNSDGSLIYVGTIKGDIFVYSDSGLVIREVKKAHGGWIWCLSLNETNSVLAFGDDGNKVKLWNASTLECFQTLNSQSNFLKTVSFSPSNNLVSGSGDNTVKVWSCC